MTDKNTKYDFFVKFMVGGISGVIAKTAVSPLDRIKLILQTQKSDVAFQDGTRKSAHYTGLINALIRIPKDQGFLSLWRGNLLSIVKFFPQQALNFSIYSYASNDTILTRLPYMWNRFISGALSGIFSMCVVYPIYFCQTRVSADTGSDLKGGSHLRKYTGLSQCISKTMKVEGFFGLYSGMYVTVLGYACYKSLYFAFFDYGKLLWKIHHPNSSSKDLPPYHVLLGIAQIASLSSTTISYPLDTVSKRIIFQSGKPAKYREYTGMINCMVSIYRQYGMKEFFAGNFTNLVRSTGGALGLFINDALLFYLGYL